MKNKAIEKKIIIFLPNLSAWFPLFRGFSVCCLFLCSCVILKTCFVTHYIINFTGNFNLIFVVFFFSIHVSVLVLFVVLFNPSRSLNKKTNVFFFFLKTYESRGSKGVFR